MNKAEAFSRMRSLILTKIQNEVSATSWSEMVKNQSQRFDRQLIGAVFSLNNLAMICVTIALVVMGFNLLSIDMLSEAILSFVGSAIIAALMVKSICLSVYRATIESVYVITEASIGICVKAWSETAEDYKELSTDVSGVIAEMNKLFCEIEDDQEDE